MERIKALVPWDFFRGLYPFNAELLNGNAMVIKACAAGEYGTILRSKEYLLFGNGLATLLPQGKEHNAEGYVMEFVRKNDARGVKYCEVQSVPDQARTPWRLEVSGLPPPWTDRTRILAFQAGDPGQYIFLAR